MPLECLMILIDNSVYARNGDALPTRLQAQLDATAALTNFTTNDNMESCVGLMTIAGANAESILTTPTIEASAVYGSFSRVRVGGHIALVRALQIAALAIKHRVRKNQSERIVVFVASEIRDSPEELFVTARNLRRNNTSVDVVNICNENNLRLLQQFMEIVNVADNSRLLNYQGGLNVLTDALRSGGFLGGAVGEQGGFQEEMDPELEMVLRISMEEEKRRLEELERQRAPPVTGHEPTSVGMIVEEDAAEAEDDEKEALISRANDAVEKESKEKQADRPPHKDNENDYIKDPAFIKEILKDLQIDPDDKKKKDEEEKGGKK